MMRKKSFVRGTVLFIAVLFLNFMNGFAGENNLYKVGVGDVLNITVLGHSDLETTVSVNPDGTITFPYINTLRVEAMTLQGIKEVLTERLSPDYIKYPEIIVRLEEAKSQKFYVYGEVSNPGVYQLTNNMTVLKAVAMAGGYSAFANTKSVKILRSKGVQSGYDEIVINLDKIVGNPDNNQDYFLKNEDIVVVVEK